MGEPTLYFGSAETGATALNATGLVVSASASATATSTISQMDADEKAYQIALQDAQSQAENSSNIMTQGTEVTFATIEQGGATGLNILNENALTTFSNFGVSLPDFGKTWKPPQIIIQNKSYFPFRAVAMNSDGTLQTALNGFFKIKNFYEERTPGAIVNSTDSGKTWIENTSAGTSELYWSDISSSSTGKYQTAVDLNYEGIGGNIWTSSDYGVTFIQNTSLGTSGLGWLSVAISSNGQYQTATETDGVWNSIDYGQTWKKNTTIDVLSSFVATSSSGEIQTLVNSQDGIWNSTDFGETWKKNATVVQTLNGITMSSDGRIQTAVSKFEGIWISSDYGITWIQKAQTVQTSFNGVAMNFLGNYQTAITDSGIFTSTNYGLSWIYNETTNSYSLSGIAISSSGENQTACGNSGLFNSTDFGKTWINTGPFISNAVEWSSVAVSSSGQYQIASGKEDGDGGLWSSTDYGNTWFQNKYISINFNYPCKCVAINSTGQIQAISTKNGIFSDEFFILLSKDYGDTWNVVYVSIGFLDGLSMNSTGQYLTFFKSDSGGSLETGIFTSEDFGNTWNLKQYIESINSAYGVVAMNSSGEIQTALTSLNDEIDYYGIWNSYDYGNTWTQNLTEGTINLVWSSVAMNSSGELQTAVSSGIWNSYDFGKSWTKNLTEGTTDLAWTSVTINSSGELQTAVSSGIWNSYDSGKTWTKNLTDGTTDLDWLSVAMNSSGELQTGCSINSFINVGSIWGSYNYGKDWKITQGETPSNFVNKMSSVALSSSGQYQSVASPQYFLTSTDYGNHWKVSSSDIPWVWVSLSSTGQYQTLGAGTNGIFFSSDYGATLKNVTLEQRDATIYSTSLSSSGQYQTACGNGIYTSVDYGNTWELNTTPGTNVLQGRKSNWKSVKLSASGQYQTAINKAFGEYKGIWTSTNYGINWSLNVLTSKYEFICSSMSSSGQYQTAVEGFPNGAASRTFVGRIWTSTDFGKTWNIVPGTNGLNWQSVTIDATGQYQMAVGLSVQNVGSQVINESGIYSSVDFGNTWTKTLQSETAGPNWRSVAISSSGQYSTMVGSFTRILTSNNPLTPPGVNYGDYLYWNETNWSIGGTDSVKLGYQSGQTGQSSYSVALGYQTGKSNQGESAIAIGANAGQIDQGNFAIAIGRDAGLTNQNSGAVAIGFGAGKTNQTYNAIAIGIGAGRTNQTDNAIAIGVNTGFTGQGLSAIAIGGFAGYADQGEYAIAIGNNAGCTSQSSNSIVFNATTDFVNADESGFYVNPIRATSDSEYVVQYNSTTKEVTYNSFSQNNSFLTIASSPPTSRSPGVVGQMLLCDSILYIYSGRWQKFATGTNV